MSARTVPGTGRRSSAVTWIDHRHAFVATTTPHGRVKITEIDHRGHSRSAGMRYLTRIVDRIGDRDRVVTVGPGRVRMRLERAYVSLVRRPEHLVDVEPAKLLDRDELVSRLAELSA